MKRLLLLPLMLASACDNGREGPAESPTAVVSDEAAREPPAPPRDGFVGRWAASPELCASGAWVFTGSQMVTAGEVACDFRQIRVSEDAWDVDATCTAEGPPQPATLRLARAPGGGLRVEGGPFEPVTLELCAENWGQPTKP